MIDDRIGEQAGARLRRIGGQLRGIEKMIRERRYCVDVLDQVAAAQAALGGLGKLLLRNHIETCVAAALADGDRAARRRKIEELVGVYGRFCKV
jgi:DNA-binding FrmR family transcriptional regulator